MLNSVCRCSIQTEYDCPQKPYSPVAVSFDGNTGIHTCEYDICSVVDLVVDGFGCDERIGVSGEWEYDGKLNGKFTWKQVGESGTMRIAYVLGNQLPTSWGSPSARWIVHKHAPTPADALNDIGNNRIAQLIDNDAGDIPPNKPWNMYCGEWINKPWTFDVQTEVPALMVEDSLCDVDYPSFSASPNYGGDWVYAGRFNERSAWKKVIGTETRWIVYLTTEQLESGWDSRWVVYRNAPSLQWIGLNFNQYDRRAQYMTNLDNELPISSDTWGMSCSEPSWPLRPWSFYLEHQVPDLEFSGITCNGDAGEVAQYKGKFNGENVWKYGINNWIVFLPASELPDHWTLGARWMVVDVESLSDITKDNIEEIRIAQKVSNPAILPPTGMWEQNCGNNNWSDLEWTFNLKNPAGRRTLETDAAPSLMRRLLNAASASDDAAPLMRRVLKQ